MAQATTSQTANSTGNQEPAGDEQSGTQRTQGERNYTPDSDSGNDQGGDNQIGDEEAPPVPFWYHQVLQKEVEAMVEKGDTEKAS